MKLTEGSVLFSKMASKRKDSDCAEKHKTAKKRQQTYLERYNEKWPFISKGKIETYVSCGISSCEISIASGVRNDIQRHNELDLKKNIKK